ncbi:TRAP transporter small permease [Bacillus sp. FJAT-44742]|uniref:TRAP transporter small permease n=1 Tax=Bacillus sp. FJAT-44742 TaxID=2014005 RepID=UPI000C23159D|nr:TRAP transporter small permease [Bacillus sp. FJAT-44742]
MRNILTGYNSFVHYINKISGWFIAILLLVMTVLISWQVFARFVMGSPLRFSEEIARFSMIWLTMVGAAYAFRKGSLISVDVVLEYAGKKISKLISIIAFLLCAGFSLILVYYGFELLDRVSAQTAPATRLSMFWPNLAIPVAGILIFLNSIALIIDEFMKKGEE